MNSIFFVLLFIFISLAILLAAIRAHNRGIYSPVVLTKLLGAATVHLIITFIAWIIIFQVNAVVISDRTSGQEKIDTQNIGLMTFIVYGFVGWLLCSVISGKFVKSISDFGFVTSKSK